MVAQQIDAGIIRSVAELGVKAAEPAVAIAAEGVVPALVARVVDVGGNERGSFGAEEGRVVVDGSASVVEHLFRHRGLQGRAGV